MRAAAAVRVANALDPYTPICVYDLVQRLGVELRFLEVDSMEGIYSAGQPPIIAISSRRRAGRQRFTCGHELGHHVFGHGTHIDQLDSPSSPRRFDPLEFIVDCFAGFLLMPKLALVSAATARGINLSQATPQQLFVLSGYFGVGYRTIIQHLCRNLGVISPEWAKVLRKTSPKLLREHLVPGSDNYDVFVADSHWVGRPIDLHLGDFLVVPAGFAAESVQLEQVASEERVIYRAAQSGLGRIVDVRSAWASYVRVAARGSCGNYVGRSIYRHEPGGDLAGASQLVRG